MSAFFANIQIRAEDLQAVANAVIGLLARAGFDLESEIYAGDRSIYLSTPGSNWVAVFDSYCDGTTVGPLAWLAQALSARLGSVALAWLIHDRALIYLLFDQGEVIDRYVSDPATFQTTTPGSHPIRSAPMGGDGETLLNTCGVVGDARRITTWLQHPDPIPHVTLERVAAALGQLYADLGHADLESDLLGGGTLEDANVFERLEFIRANPRVNT